METFRHLLMALLVFFSGCSPQQLRRIDGEPIMGTDSIDMVQLERFLLRHNPAIDRSYARQLADTYLRECRTEGVRVAVAFCQMCLETGFLSFTGAVAAEQNNFCGFGATGDGRTGERFPDMETGVRVQVQHLKAYATPKSTKRRCIDNRRHLVLLGSAPAVDELAGRWAADPNYGTKICRLLEELHSE
jgi:hypothetical protein